MTIYEKLSEIQSRLKAPKSQFNKFGNYAYRNCEDILEAVKPLCKEYGTVATLSDELVNIGDRYYIKATAKLTDYKTLEVIDVTAYAREEETKKGMDGSQITGASSSYARKYALNGLFNIDDTKDSDGTNKHDKEELPQPKTSGKIKENERQLLIKEVCKLAGGDEKGKELLKQWLADNEIASTKDIINTQVPHLVKFIKEAIK